VSDLDWLDEAIRGREVRGLDARDLQEYRRAMLEEALLESVERELATRTDWTLPEP
jgi:hypothetical protein